MRKSIFAYVEIMAGTVVTGNCLVYAALHSFNLLMQSNVVFISQQIRVVPFNDQKLREGSGEFRLNVTESQQYLRAFGGSCRYAGTGRIARR